MSTPAARAELEALLRAALAGADARRAVHRAVTRDGNALALAGQPLPPGARLVCLAAGKAAAAMAVGLEETVGDRVVRGLVVTKDGHGGAAARLPPHWTVREAGHPVPDARSLAAADEALALAAEAGHGDVLVVLLSGGASALLTRPLPGLALADLAATTRALLEAGADIGELNTVRKHLLAVAGGRLARAAGAGRVVLLAVSDVLGDRLDVIGSGPCSPDPSRHADAIDVLARRGLLDAVPPAVRAHLESGARGEQPESPKPGDPVFARVHAAVLVSNVMALAAARDAARARGGRAVVVTSALRGEARDAGRRLAALAQAVRSPRPVHLLVAGETTVTVRGRGRGGRCQELALAAALALDGTSGIDLLAAGTDGTDGPTDAAGAFADGGSVARGAARGVSAAAALADNDAHGFFVAAGGLLHTGPTGTNVMDLVLLRVAPRPGGGSKLPVPEASQSV